MPRPATPLHKKIVKLWLNEKVNEIQQGNQAAGNQIYNVVMMTDQELGTAIASYLDRFIAQYNSEADSLDAAAVARRAEAAALEE